MKLLRESGFAAPLGPSWNMYRTPSTVRKQQVRDDEALARALQAEFDDESTSRSNPRAFTEPFGQFQAPTSLFHPFPVHAATFPPGGYTTVLPQRVNKQPPRDSALRHLMQQQPPPFGHSQSLGRTLSDPDMLSVLLPYGFSQVDDPSVQSHSSQSQPRVIPVTYVGDENTTGVGNQRSGHHGKPLNSTSAGTATSASSASRGQWEHGVPFGLERSDSDGPNRRWLELMHAGDEWTAANTRSSTDTADSASAAGAHAAASSGASGERAAGRDSVSSWEGGEEGGLRQRGPLASVEEGGWGGRMIGNRSTGENDGSLHSFSAPSATAAAAAFASSSSNHVRLNAHDYAEKLGAHTHSRQQHMHHEQQQQVRVQGTRAGEHHASQRESEAAYGRSNSLERGKQWQQQQQQWQRCRQEQEDRDYALALTMASPDMGERGERGRE